MQADPPTLDPQPPVDATPGQRRSYAHWQAIGLEALRLTRPPVSRPLREVVAECEALIVYEHWLAHAQNHTRTAEALGMSRRRVRKIVKAVAGARTREENDPYPP